MKRLTTSAGVSERGQGERAATVRRQVTPSPQGTGPRLRRSGRLHNTQTASPSKPTPCAEKLARRLQVVRNPPLHSAEKLAHRLQVVRNATPLRQEEKKTHTEPRKKSLAHRHCRLVAPPWPLPPPLPWPRFGSSLAPQRTRSSKSPASRDSQVSGRRWTVRVGKRSRLQSGRERFCPSGVADAGKLHREISTRPATIHGLCAHLTALEYRH